MYHHTGKSLSLGSHPVSEVVQIRVSCKFLGSMFRSLAQLSGGLARFLPVILAHMSAGSCILVGFSVDSVSHVGTWNPVFLVALIPCRTLWVTHWGLPLLQLTAPVALDIALFPLHPGFLPGHCVWVVERGWFFPTSLAFLEVRGHHPLLME